MCGFKIFAVKGSYEGFDCVEAPSGYLMRNGEVVHFETKREVMKAFRKLDTKNCTIIDYGGELTAESFTNKNNCGLFPRTAYLEKDEVRY